MFLETSTKMATILETTFLLYILEWHFVILIEIWLKYVAKGLIDYQLTLFQAMALAETLLTKIHDILWFS